MRWELRRIPAVAERPEGVRAMIYSENRAMDNPHYLGTLEFPSEQEWGEFCDALKWHKPEDVDLVDAREGAQGGVRREPCGPAHGQG